MKKILFVDTGYEYGGGTKSLLCFLENLEQYTKYQFSVFFENDYRVGEQNISEIINNLGVKFIKFMPKRQPTKIIKELLRIFSKETLAKYLYQKDYKYAIAMLSNEKPDIIHLNNHFSTNLAYIEAANVLGIKVIQHLRKNSPIEPFKLKILKKQKFIPICISNSTYEFYAKQIEIQKNIIYNPVIVNKEITVIDNIKFDKNKINIIMPANFLTLKGHELVFDALTILKRDDVKVYFAGSGELTAGAKGKFDMLIKSGKAQYLGFVQQMGEIYKNCDYVLGFSSDEGLSRVVIEGLSCGLGVIYSDIPVMREIYNISSKKEDFFIVQRDPRSLLKCLENLAKPSSKAPDSAVINTFSLDNYIRSVDAIYSDL